MSIDPENEFVYLTGDGRGTVIPGGPAFWSRPEQELEGFGRGWLITQFVCTQDWASWEMHPAAEEFVYLLDGEVEFLLDLPSGIQGSRLVDRGAVLVPRGVWHTARVFKPSRMLFVTMGAGTRHKAANGA